MLLSFAKKLFYRFFPSGHLSAYIRTVHMKKALHGLSFREVLDAGCSEGAFTLFFAERTPAARFTGYDISETAIRKARVSAQERRLSNVRFEVQDLTEMNDTARYDFIYSVECLEHIPGNRKAVQKLVEAVAPGGRLLLMMPCEKIHRYLFPQRWFQKYIAWAAAEHIGEQYTLEELVTLLKRLGLRILKAHYTFGVWGKLAWEISMLTEEKKALHRCLLPLLLTAGLLDAVWPFEKRHPYGLLILGEKV